MNVAQLISAADSPASSPQGSPVGSAQPTRRAAEDGNAWATRVRDLKTRLAAEQHELLALVAAYEDAAEQLQFETECQQVLVDKYAQIRARRMQTFLRAPESGMMVFLEETERKSQQPEAPRRDLRVQLIKQWTLMSDDEQEVWNAKFRTLYSTLQVGTKKQSHTGLAQLSSGAKKSVVGGGLKSASASVPAKHRNSLPGSSAKPGVSGVGTEPKSKKRKPAAPASDPEALSTAAPTPKKKRTPPAKKKTATPAAEDGAEGEKSEIATPSKAKKRRAAPKTASAKKETPAKPKSDTVAANPGLNVSESVKKKPAATKKKSTPTPPQQRQSAKAAAVGAARTSTQSRAKKLFGKSKSAAAKKRLTDNDGDNNVSDEDDDDDNDDDDDEEDEGNDNDSLSSAGGSASDDDSDEHMAQLPSGAFG